MSVSNKDFIWAYIVYTFFKWLDLSPDNAENLIKGFVVGWYFNQKLDLSLTYFFKLL